MDQRRIPDLNETEHGRKGEPALFSWFRIVHNRCNHDHEGVTGTNRPQKPEKKINNWPPRIQYRGEEIATWPLLGEKLLEKFVPAHRAWGSSVKHRNVAFSGLKVGGLNKKNGIITVAGQKNKTPSKSLLGVLYLNSELTQTYGKN